MLEGVDRRTVLGRRDYAILLLLVTYGLRSREIELGSVGPRWGLAQATRRHSRQWAKMNPFTNLLAQQF